MDLKTFHGELLTAIERMDGVVSASPIEQADLVIGAELEDGATVFIEIQPA